MWPWSKADTAREGLAPAVPAGRRIYAVGDIHGRADLLAGMAALVAQDLAERPAPAALTIFLGDYIDRGPASAAVIDRLARSDFPTPIVALRGNHEDMFIGLLCGDVELAPFEQIGGTATLLSYGVDPATAAAADAARRSALLLRAVPETHCAFLDELRLSVTLGDYFFCHAGVRPGVPLDLQSADDLLWIREPFLRSTADFGKVVVHGHTPVREPLIRPNGIAIDTHAFASGTLTALVLDDTDMRFLRTGSALVPKSPSPRRADEGRRPG